MKILNNHELNQVSGGILLLPNGTELNVSTGNIPMEHYIQIESVVQMLLFSQITPEEFRNQIYCDGSGCWGMSSSISSYMANFKTAYNNVFFPA
ncbi:MAG: bacteriocin [Proteobacteria bacterium]|nr:bacteriocin [Pseudomonadota bacterium]